MYKNGYEVGPCPHAVGVITVCSLCLMRRVDAVDRMEQVRQESYDLSETVRVACKEKDWKQADLARFLGISQEDLSHAKKGKRPLPPPAFRRLSEAFSLKSRTP